MRNTKYDWNIVREDYLSGLTWRELRSKYGMAFRSIYLAVKRGDLPERTQLEAYTISERRGRRHKTVHTEEFKKSVSERQSLHNTGGRCKWFQVADQIVQGTWERDLALTFEQHGITWNKVGRTKRDIWWYIWDGVSKAYTPDFYLPDYDLFLEIKGYWWGSDQEKMKLVIEQHPLKKIIIVQKMDFEKMKSGDFSYLGLPGLCGFDSA